MYQLSPELQMSLQETQLCKNLFPDELDLLVAHNKIVSYAAGETILQQGKPSKGIYLILVGEAIVTAKVLGEGATNIAILSHGNFFGEISILENGPCATSVTAIREIQCLLITKQYFDMLTLLYPDTKFKILHAIVLEICFRLKNLHSKISSLMTMSDMTTRSSFDEVIKSFTKTTTIKLSDTDIDKDILKNTEIFSTFTNDEYEELLQHFIVIKAPKQCTLIYEDDKNTSCYITLRGAVQASIVKDNKVAKLSILGPLSIFCSISAVNHIATSIINYTTRERVILLQITESELDKLHKNHSQLWNKFFYLIIKSFVALERSADKLEIRLNSELYNR